MATTPSELIMTLPVFTEVNGVRYNLGTFELPVGIKVARDDGHTLTITGDIGDPEDVAEDIAEQFRRANIAARRI